MSQLTYRQRKIVDFIASRESTQNQDVVDFLKNEGNPVTRKTVMRELFDLVAADHIVKTGQGRGVSYKVKIVHHLLKPIDHESYFNKGQDERLPQRTPFNHEVIDKLQSIFSTNELAEISMKNEVYLERRARLSDTIVKKELERLIIELAWKSSKIEGNSYSLFETDALISEHTEAPGHSREEAVMILNHKKAFDYILANKEKFFPISVREIENVHRLLVDGLGVNHGIRNIPVGIRGTNYIPLDNPVSIKDALERTVVEINKAQDPWTRSLLSLMMIAYIQPFEDGNKRTSRMIANACLIAGDACPLSLRSVDVMEYKKAITLFYELQNVTLLKKMFQEQVDFSVKNYFR